MAARSALLSLIQEAADATPTKGPIEEVAASGKVQVSPKAAALPLNKRFSVAAVNERGEAEASASARGDERAPEMMRPTTSKQAPAGTKDTAATLCGGLEVNCVAQTITNKHEETVWLVGRGVRVREKRRHAALPLLPGV